VRVLALGSCRVHEPLTAAADAGEIEYLNRDFRRNRPVYVHDIHEAIQFVRLARREIAMPGEIRPFAYERGLHVDRGMTGALERVQRVVVELCTDKHYEAAGWTLNVNELHRQLVENAGPAGQEWWDTIDRRERPSEALVLNVEAELKARWRTRWRFGKGHRLMLRELTFRYESASEIADGLIRLASLVAAPILVVSHVAVRLPDGNYLAERLQHVGKVIEAARAVGLPSLDPRAFVVRDGQSRVLAERGQDYHHYAPDYVPIVGREIVRALRSSAADLRG
jgi:hypothetical protein